ALETYPQQLPIRPRGPTVPENKTSLVEFDSAPFPYSGRGHGPARHSPYRVHDEYSTYNDPHVLLHIPKGFDPSRPAVMIVFFHGHRATLARDVRDRQQLPAQIAASGMNAVLVAPQFAVNAADSSPGKFGESGAFARFLDEAAAQLAAL